MILDAAPGCPGYLQAFQMQALQGIASSSKLTPKMQPFARKGVFFPSTAVVYCKRMRTHAGIIFFCRRCRIECIKGPDHFSCWQSPSSV